MSHAYKLRIEELAAMARKARAAPAPAPSSLPGAIDRVEAVLADHRTRMESLEAEMVKSDRDAASADLLRARVLSQLNPQ